jgi:hypothetical protein
MKSIRAIRVIRAIRGCLPSPRISAAARLGFALRSGEWAGQPSACGRLRPLAGGRKVRAPQDRVVDNVDRPRGQGKCNRKQTAVGGRFGVPPVGKGETVR